MLRLSIVVCIVIDTLIICSGLIIHCQKVQMAPANKAMRIQFELKAGFLASVRENA